MKKRDNLPLNYKERLNSRTSFLVSIAVLVVLCLVFNQMDYTMIRQPAAQAKKAADLQKQKEEEATATTQEVTTATVLAVGDNLVQPSLLASGQSETGAWNYDSVYPIYRLPTLLWSIRKHLSQQTTAQSAVPRLTPLLQRLATHL